MNINVHFFVQAPADGAERWALICLIVRLADQCLQAEGVCGVHHRPLSTAQGNKLRVTITPILDQAAFEGLVPPGIISLVPAQASDSEEPHTIPGPRGGWWTATASVPTHLHEAKGPRRTRRGGGRDLPDSLVLGDTAFSWGRKKLQCHRGRPGWKAGLPQGA